MSLCRPERSCSVLLVRRIDRLWDFLFCFCWRAAALLPLSTGIAASKTRCNHSLKGEKSQERRWLRGQETKGLVEMICFTLRHRRRLCCTWLCLCLAASTRECVKWQSGGVWNWVPLSVRTQQTLGENLKVAQDEEEEKCATITESLLPVFTVLLDEMKCCNSGWATKTRGYSGDRLPPSPHSSVKINNTSNTFKPTNGRIKRYIEGWDANNDSLCKYMNYIKDKKLVEPVYVRRLCIIQGAVLFLCGQIPCLKWFTTFKKSHTVTQR